MRGAVVVNYPVGGLRMVARYSLTPWGRAARRGALAAAALLVVNLSAYGQKGGNREDDTSPLGGLGVAGRNMSAAEAAPYGAPAGQGGFGVWAVNEKDLGAASGLRRGDIIVAVNKQPVSGVGDGALAIEAEIEKAEESGGVLECQVIDTDKKSRAVKVKTAKLGKMGATPKECAKTKAVIARGLSWLADAQQSDGSYRNATNLGGNDARVVMSSLAGLCFIGAGNTPTRGPYAQNVQKCMEYVLKTVGQKEAGGFGGMGGMGGGNWNQENWQLAYAPIFLSELAHHHQDTRLLGKVKEIIDKLIANQEASGGWAHGPGGPNALGYVELEIVSNWALSGIGMAKAHGIKVPDAPLGKALDWIEATSPGDGGVGYSTRPGQVFGDPGRTAGAIFAITRLDGESWGFFPKMKTYYSKNYKDLAEGHVSPVMHVLQGALASHAMGAAEYKKWWDAYRGYIMVSRWSDGSLLSRPSKESLQMGRATDLDMGACWTTPNLLLAMLLDAGNFKGLVGKPKKAGGGKPDAPVAPEKKAPQVTQGKRG
ncbi:MAG: hypothetical protein HY719_07060 [Planctomycetes bacterium]|nr:hypothetical protein [Planctomycetota bacterium]